MVPKGSQKEVYYHRYKYDEMKNKNRDARDQRMLYPTLQWRCLKQKAILRNEYITWYLIGGNRGKALPKICPALAVILQKGILPNYSIECGTRLNRQWPKDYSAVSNDQLLQQYALQNAHAFCEGVSKKKCMPRLDVFTNFHSVIDARNSCHLGVSKEKNECLVVRSLVFFYLCASWGSY